MRLTAGARQLAVGVTATAVVLPAILTVTASSAAADRTYYVPVTSSWHVVGRGYGHGRGMSQYGAEGAARQGLSAAKILSFYYPGTKVGRVKGRVAVLISSDSTSDLQVRPHRGLRVRAVRDGAQWRLPVHKRIDRWRLVPARNGTTAVQFHNRTGWHRWRVPDGRRTFRGNAEFVARGPLTLLVPGGGGVVGKRYRGVLRLVRPYRGATTRDTVNVVGMNAYVQGVLPDEMPASWRRQALRAQAVAARTYAAYQRRQNPNRYYQICDTTACQVYGGLAAETSATNAAVRATSQRIRTYRSAPALTQFTASSGGWTASGGTPYLPAKRDPYDDYRGNTVHSWTVKVNPSLLEANRPEIGRLIDLRVTRRDGHGAWNGRVGQVRVDGSAGSASMTGDDFRFLFGLRSTWFTISPTPIIERWRKLGGPKSALGAPKSGEYAVGGGSAQRFASGRIFWSRRTGANELLGPILSAYRHWGGPASNLRWPTTGMRGAANGGQRVRFAGGAIYSHRRVGAHVLYGRVLRRWAAAGAAGSWLGYPTSDVFSVSGGKRAKFRHGVITWHRASNSYTVRRT